MRFVVTNFWSAPRSLRRRNLSGVRNPKPGSSQNIAPPIVASIPLAYEGNSVDPFSHFAVNDSTSLRKTA